MLRITIVRDAEFATLKLEGKLLEPWIEDLRKACAAAHRLSRSLRLDLSEVHFVDSAGEREIAALLRDGVAIAGCSAFLRELLQVGWT